MKMKRTNTDLILFFVITAAISTIGIGFIHAYEKTTKHATKKTRALKKKKELKKRQPRKPCY